MVLSIVNDAFYPDNNQRLVELMAAVKPGSRPWQRRREGAVITAVSWTHWPCLFPQHGPGPKHTRPIVLQEWQRVAVAEQPAAFARGLMHSDGSRVRNWATRPVGGEQRRYEYPRWQFSNRSADIRGLMCWSLDLLGVPWRQSSPVHVSVSRRAAVARLDELIGLKS